MAYALGYDKGDFASDDEDDLPLPTSSRHRSSRSVLSVNSVPGSLPPALADMDKLDTATLERLEWMEPLGYRVLADLTGLPPATLRKHFWASNLKPTSTLYSDIDYYFRNSHSHTHTSRMRINRVVELKRYTERNADYTVPNVQLLWHGTETRNVGSILTNGFRLPTRSGMFGQGVYFADRVTKSAQYCRVGGGRGSKGVLFLCAVNLGRVHQSGSGMNGITAPPNGYDSVMGCGNNVPDPSEFRTHRGASIPCGRTIQFRHPRAGLIHNEFIVYDLSKVAILFLVEFENV